uniref:ESAG8 associated protein n=1 Tax=Trypanosoma brucei brucei TaxID=5702 RepID=Q9XML1_TRYBB|nr:ESAG8 associated protein [Trypanosoma brucei brucei]
MSHFQPSPCFNTFSSFLQEITNIGSSGIDTENKENIPPGSFGRLNDGKGGCRRNSSHTCFRKQQQHQEQHQQQQFHNIPRVNDCCTPMKEVTYQQQQCHTGLTPGNKYMMNSANRDYPVGMNGIDFLLLDESDVFDGRDNGFFTPNVKRQGGVTGNHGKVSELFHESMEAPRLARNLNDSIEGVPLVGNFLQESDDEDCLDSYRPTEMSSTQIFNPRLQGQESRHCPQDHCSYQKQVHQQPSDRSHLLGSAWCETAPRSKPQPERNHTATRVTHGTTPLVAVAGRRVPVDKLHLLLGATAQDGVDGQSGARDAVNTAPLVPSSRPTPSAAQTFKVIPLARPSEPSVSPSPLATTPQNTVAGPTTRRLASSSFHKEMVVIDFGKGNIMRFKPNPAFPPPVPGKRYLVAVRASRSPYDNVAYKDAGLCSYVLRHPADGSGANGTSAAANITITKSSGDVERGIFDGSIIRCMDTPGDAVQLQLLAVEREAAIVECRKHFKFLNLPFELVDVHYTFDRTICVVYYNIHRQEGTSGHPNVSRLVRTLQFRLKCKVHLKADFCSD